MYVHRFRMTDRLPRIVCPYFVWLSFAELMDESLFLTSKVQDSDLTYFLEDEKNFL